MYSDDTNNKIYAIQKFKSISQISIEILIIVLVSFPTEKDTWREAPTYSTNIYFESNFKVKGWKRCEVNNSSLTKVERGSSIQKEEIYDLWRKMRVKKR